MGCETDRAVEVLRMRLGLPADSDVEAVLTEAEDRLATLMRESAEREANEKVTQAFKAGKLTAAQRDWAFALALTDPAAFDSWQEAAPQIVRLGQTRSPSAGVRVHNSREREAIVASARVSYRSEPSLSLVTSESSWIEQALREAGFDVSEQEKTDN